jgi:DNA-binding transcriptional LysR family regulator
MKKHKPPRNPGDLLQHRLLAFSFWKPKCQWSFHHINGSKETLTFQPYFSMNDYAGLATALLAGAGIGDLPPVVAPSLLREGRLVEIMPKWKFRNFDLPWSMPAIATCREWYGCSRNSQPTWLRSFFPSYRPSQAVCRANYPIF